MLPSVLCNVFPGGTTSNFSFIVVARTRCCGFLAFVVWSASKERDTPLENMVTPSRGISCDQCQHDASSDLVVVGVGRFFSLWRSSTMASRADVTITADDLRPRSSSAH